MRQENRKEDPNERGSNLNRSQDRSNRRQDNSNKDHEHGNFFDDIEKIDLDTRNQRGGDRHKKSEMKEEFKTDHMTNTKDNKDKESERRRDDDKVYRADNSKKNSQGESIDEVIKQEKKIRPPPDFAPGPLEKEFTPFDSRHRR